MDVNRVLGNQWLKRVFLIVWIVGGVVAIFLLSRIDSIVNGTLYAYHLSFNTAWADPYWTYLRVTYGLLVLTVVSSSFFLAVDFVNARNNGLKEDESEVQNSLMESQTAGKKDNSGVTFEVRLPAKAAETETVQCVSEPKIQSNPVEQSATEKNGTNNMFVISCPSCKKVFSRPLVMLDFTEGRTRLINVCPYCSHSLGETENSDKHPDKTA
jgi:hypothetical protein